MEETGKHGIFIPKANVNSSINYDGNRQCGFKNASILTSTHSFNIKKDVSRKIFARSRSCLELRREGNRVSSTKSREYSSRKSGNNIFGIENINENLITNTYRCESVRSISSLDFKTSNLTQSIRKKFTSLLRLNTESYDLKSSETSKERKKQIIEKSFSFKKGELSEIKNNKKKINAKPIKKLKAKKLSVPRLSNERYKSETRETMFSYLAKVHCESGRGMGLFSPKQSKFKRSTSSPTGWKIYNNHSNVHGDENTQRLRSKSLNISQEKVTYKRRGYSLLNSFTSFDIKERPEIKMDAKQNNCETDEHVFRQNKLSENKKREDFIDERQKRISETSIHSNSLSPINAYARRKKLLCRAVSASPSTRRRRISVKSSHIRKQSIKPSQPRQRRLTVSASSFQGRPTLNSTIHRSDGDASGISSAVIPSRRLSVAVGRKPSNVSQHKRPQRRSSEPFLLDPLTIQNKWGRKYSTVTRAYGRRRVSTTATLPTSSKQKLQALAKDELLASLNVPLSRPDLTVVSPHEKTDDFLKQESVDDLKKDDDKTRKENKRMMIIEEILETEKNYISCLETLNIVFRTQLENSNIITVKDLMSLFPSHLHEIKNSHSWFMKELEERMLHENWRGIIGDIFAKMTSASANLLEIYTCYVNAFPKSISTLSKCTRSSQKFRKFLEDCYENPLVERLDLPSFLLSPVQRLPRYILLLRELLKYTDEDHPDHYFIGEAMKEMECLISSLNDSIQSSMEFYSATEGRRKKMSRQFTSKKRKQRTSQTNRSQKKMMPLNETRSTDGDQGYCSFSERKDESPEDDSQNPRKSRSSTWRGGVSKRSMSMISSSSEENKAANGASNSSNNIPRRKTEFGRNSDTRKSWRRSLGAVFSQIWSKDDANNQPRRESASATYKSADGLEKIETVTVDKSKSEDDLWKNSSASNENNLSVSQDQKDGSSFKRKKGVQSPTSPQDIDEDSVQDISNLIRDSSLDECQESVVSIAVSSHNSSVTSIDVVDRRTSVASIRSNNSLKTPGSPQFFKRDKLRGSAGPAFKSIFNKNKLSKKTLSWDELNIERSNSYTQPQIDRKQKRYSISIRRPKFTKQDNIRDLRPLVMEKSASSNNVNDETLSTSSNDTISSRTSSQSKDDVSMSIDVNADNNNNNSNNQNENVGVGQSSRPSKEKKHKFMKTLRSFVGKTK